jgi:AP-2 complex subunit alpha
MRIIISLISKLSQQAVLFEAINLAIHLDANSPLVVQSTELLSRFISAKETNLRYLGLDALSHLAACSSSLDVLRQNYETIIVSLSDKDISVRRFNSLMLIDRRALDLLYSMSDHSNYKTIIKELLHYLSLAEFAIREELVLKIAILSEKFFAESSWYFDTMFQLIIGAGDVISDDVWHRVVQIISCDESIHAYSAKKAMDSIEQASGNENVVKIASYILGEYGHLIAEEEGYNPIDQLKVIEVRMMTASVATRSIILTTLLKFVNVFPEIKQRVIKILESYRSVLDVELQQRACEYHAIAIRDTPDILETVCDAIPPFSARGSALVERLQSKLTDTEDKR